MQSVSTVVRGRVVDVARGGAGPSLLLLHGGYAGARAHWETVWPRLEGHFQLIAPDLPGLGAVRDPPLPTVAAYTDWLVSLLDSLGVASVACVGNSFGATLAWSFAGRHPRRCHGLILVDGFPMPATPAPLAWLSRLPGVRPLGVRVMQRFVYTPTAFEKAFADASHVPRAMHDAVRTWPVLVPRFLELMLAGDGPPAPEVAPLLIWGRRDRLPGSHPRVAERWRRRIPDASLRILEDAGHFPQIEAPAAFTEAVVAHLGHAPA